MAIWDVVNKRFLCECGCGIECLPWVSGPRGHYVRTLEICDKISESLTGTVQSDETISKRAESVRKAREADPTIIERISGTLTGRTISQEIRDKISASTLGVPKSEEHCRHNIEARKRQWQDPDFARYMRECGFSSGVSRPNRSELMLWEDIQEFLPGGWEMNVVKGFRIAGLVPDFINFERKQVIELFGRYYHEILNTKTEEEVIQVYRESGWDCLIVWDDSVRLGCAVADLLSFGEVK